MPNLEQNDSDSLMIAATNHPELLDRALFRRFDDVIEYHLPDQKEIASTLKSKLVSFKTGRIVWSKVAQQTEGLSYGDQTCACEDAIKDVIIHDRDRVKQADLSRALEERKHLRQG